jgi:hypothetical protein
MKKISILIPIILLLTVIISCKDNPYNPIVPPQSVTLFEKDSITAASSDSGLFNISETASYPIIDSTIKNLNLKFSLQTNAIGDSDQIFYGVYLSKPGISYLAQYEYLTRNIDTSYNNIYFIRDYKNMTAKFLVAIYKKVDHSYKYVKLKNMKVIKID